LVTARPQTIWSKALVRHGADPGEALAGVLGWGPPICGELVDQALYDRRGWRADRYRTPSQY